MSVFGCLPDNVREIIRDDEQCPNGYYGSSRLADASESEVYHRIQSILDVLTPDTMHDMTGENVYLREGVRPNDDLENQIAWATEIKYNNDEIEQMLQIQRIFKEAGQFQISLAQATLIWETYSNCLDAQWICHQDDEHTWANILGFFIWDDMMDKYIEEE